ncbi:MAG: hypothetical protein N2645_18405 [Clostridia bacterium]|nr:hypothetical protein [Clostridia bacterium]
MVVDGMEAILNFFGLTPPPGLEYLGYILRGCLSIVVLVELFGMIKSLLGISTK